VFNFLYPIANAKNRIANANFEIAFATKRHNSFNIKALAILKNVSIF